MVNQIYNPKVLKKPMAAEAPLVEDIPERDQSTNQFCYDMGFPQITMRPYLQGGLPPRGLDMNTVLNLITQHLYQLQEGGKYTFDQDVSDAIGGYPKGAWLNVYTGDRVVTVESLIPNNTYNFVTHPEYIDGVRWDYLSQTLGDTNLANALVQQNLSVVGNANFQGVTTAVTPAATDLSNKVATTAWVGSNAVRPGVIVMYGGNTLDGYLKCVGGAVSRTTYAALYAAIGTRYGAGDGSTTFDIPDFNDRYPRGNDYGYSNQTLPNVVGAVTNMATAQGGYNEGGATPSGTGAFVASKTSGTYNKDDGNHYSHGNGQFDFNASRSNGTYGAANKNGQTGYVMPFTTHVNFFIKY